MRIVPTLLITFLVSLPACGSSPVQNPSEPRFVAVGVDGTILQSPDRETWASIASGTTAHLSSIAFGAGVFVAVGEGGIILVSTDGIDFSPHSKPAGVDLVHVIYTGERFVAVGGDFEVGAVTVTSNDGRTWDVIESPSGFMFHAVAHQNNTLIAAAYSRSDLQTPALFRAEPGQPWQGASGPDFRDSVTTAAGVFTLGGSVIHQSVDGVTWSSQTIAGGIAAHAMAEHAGQFVVVGEQGALFSSSNATNFDDHSLTDVLGYFSGVEFGEDRYVAVGNDGLIAVSPDGAEWSKLTPPTSNTLLDVAYGTPAYP